MELSIPSFVDRIFSPPGAAPIVCVPNRRWSRGATPSPRLALKVVDIVAETPTTRTLVFDRDDLPYQAGQHLTVVVDVDGHTERRCYSFSTSPATGGRPAITVKRVEGGVVSNWLHDRVAVGDTIEASPPSGRFTTSPGDGSPRHLVLVAGGVGITPLVSMAETVLREEEASRITLLYGSRCENEIIFRERLEQLAARFQDRFEVVFVLDDAPVGWAGRRGRLDGEQVVAAVGSQPVDEWLVCGPEPMMDSVVAALGRGGVEDGRIRLERFQYAEKTTVAIPTAPATLVFVAQGREVEARAGRTILEAAEEAGVRLPSSCRMGGCGACKVQVRGTVVAAEPNCLSEQEKADGYALACCSYADGRVEIRDGEAA